MSVSLSWCDSSTATRAGVEIAANIQISSFRGLTNSSSLAQSKLLVLSAYLLLCVLLLMIYAPKITSSSTWHTHHFPPLPTCSGDPLSFLSTLTCPRDSPAQSMQLQECISDIWKPAYWLGVTVSVSWDGSGAEMCEEQVVVVLELQ